MVRVRDKHGQAATLPGSGAGGDPAGSLCRQADPATASSGRSTRPFHYINKGNLATIGRGKAVADLPLIRLTGLPAWLIWLGVHIFYLIGHQNRVVVMVRWWLSFLSHGRTQGSRIIAGMPPREGGPERRTIRVRRAGRVSKSLIRALR